MNGKDFVRSVRQWARKNGRPKIRVVNRGKGSHETLYVGELWTTVKQDGITPTMKGVMLKQLGLPKDAF